MHLLIRNIGLAAVGAALIAAAFVLLDGSGHGATPAGVAMPAMPVPVERVVQRTVPVYLDFFGTTEAVRSVTLEAEVSGYLNSQAASDGADVQKGQLIYQIDPRSYQATLDRAVAVARRDAAALEYARVTQGRKGTLAKEGWVALQNLDQSSSALRQSQATLAADTAAIQTAKLNLGWTEIRAPFAGRLGHSRVHEGTLIAAAGTPLNTLVQLDPIYVSFAPSETDLAKLQRYRTGEAIPAEVTVPDDGDERYDGTLTFLNNTVDSKTGTVMARTTIANPHHTLLPGEFVDVRLRVGNRANTLLVPQAALGSDQFGKYVYVAEQGRAAQRMVTIGANYGDMVVITKGLAPHDEVIVGNLQKIASGTPVRPIPKREQAVAATPDAGGQG